MSYYDPGDQNVEPPPKDSTDPLQATMFDSLPYQRHSETSREAAEAAKPTASTYRRQVLDYLRIRVIPCGADRLPGATDEEMQDDLQLNPSTQRPRRVELVSAGLVRDSGRKRKTKSGRWAVVWEAV